LGDRAEQKDAVSIMLVGRKEKKEVGGAYRNRRGAPSFRAGKREGEKERRKVGTYHGPWREREKKKHHSDLRV